MPQLSCQFEVRGEPLLYSAGARHFHKPASQLTMDECARLAAMLPNPLHHRSPENSEYAIKKKELVLQWLSNR